MTCINAQGFMVQVGFRAHACICTQAFACTTRVCNFMRHPAVHACMCPCMHTHKFMHKCTKEGACMKTAGCQQRYDTRQDGREHMYARRGQIPGVMY